MARVHAQGMRVKQFILDQVERSSTGVASATCERFGISRQAVNRYLRQLCDEGILQRSGHTRATQYRLVALSRWERVYSIASKPAEDVVWVDDVRSHVGELSDNVLNIWDYGFTEMFNNAIDHSEGARILVSVAGTAVSTEMMISDDGFGIFKKIQKELGLLDERHSVLELSKGKLTTDPQNHTGEGIFFTSRMFDHFQILSGGVYFSHEFGKAEDWILERNGGSDGTSVFMKLRNRTSRTIKEVFDEFATGDDFVFSKTVVPVRLARYGQDQLISRSQAKRLLARVELFKTVLFDFNDVETIGPAFADEIFRVFSLRHPEIQLTPVNANSHIRKMIRRAMENKAVVSGLLGTALSANVSDT